MTGVKAGAVTGRATTTGTPVTMSHMSRGKILCPPTSGGETVMTKFPLASVLPVPSTTSSPLPQILSFPQSTICMQLVLLGTPVPLTWVEPPCAPLVMIGTIGVGVGVGVRVGVWVGVRVIVPVDVGVRVGVPVAVLVGVPVWVGVFVGVKVVVGVLVVVCVGVLVGVSVSVGVFVGVRVAVPLGVLVGVAVSVGVFVGVCVGVTLGVSVGELVAVAVGVSVGVAVGTGTSRHCENSEVLLFGSVAVAVMNCPAETVADRTMAFMPVKSAVHSGIAPMTLVLTIAEPMKVCPSPKLDGSHAALA